MEKLLNYMQEILGFSDKTRREYETSLGHYTKFHNMTLEQLLEEAEEDEDNGVKKRRRRINDRLFDFKKHMETTTWVHPVNKIEGHYSASTIHKTFAHIKAFYNVFEISMPKIRNLPPIKAEKYEDSITKEMIVEVLKTTSNLKHRAIIISMAVSGLDGDSLRKLTWNNFSKATEEYHNGGSINEQLEKLRKMNEPIAMFKDVRGKTEYEHIFFFSPEAVIATCNYGLSLKKELQPDELIFNISGIGLSKVFSRANDRLSLGKTSRGTRRVFHAHGLRNYMGTTLLGTTYDGMMLDTLMIEFMLGHAIDPTTAAYYKRNPEVLKETYIRIMPKLSIEDVNVRDVDSPQYKRMEAELARYKKLEGRVNELETLKVLFNNKDELINNKIQDLDSS